MKIMQTALGRLQFNVFDLTVARPISNATIRILGTDDSGNNNIVNELISNSSGQTDAIELPCPPKEYSLVPEQPKPYSQYRIEATAEGFEPISVNGAQIFADTLALQRLHMRPIANNANEQENINVGSPTLWGEYPPKIPEEEIKPIPDASGFVVLDKPVIPEYIVVHDGSPNDNTAPDYYVKFKDYIKNVASSEIYSTWPDAALRANILAIISFTLNRVFTEWYRNMGKNFTITSSTAYDHAFFYGRNIYEEINIVVDEMFTTYITKPDIRQPLFAQYCDGIKVSCPNWLSQWGCKDLADQGYSAVDILRTYYGSNIYLAQAEKVNGIPASFPGENLQTGSRGEDVRVIQTQLNTISNNYPALPRIRVDGVFGKSTRDAVMTFQEIFNLPPSGIVDFPTWYRISEVYVAVAKLAELT